MVKFARKNKFTIFRTLKNVLPATSVILAPMIILIFILMLLIHGVMFTRLAQNKTNSETASMTNAAGVIENKMNNLRSLIAIPADRSPGKIIEENSSSNNVKLGVVAEKDALNKETLPPPPRIPEEKSKISKPKKEFDVDEKRKQLNEQMKKKHINRTTNVKHANLREQFLSDNKRYKIRDRRNMPKISHNTEITRDDDGYKYDKSKYKTPGIFVLGMHRSGTSLLSGLLALGSKYNVGDNLMQAHADNPKGFFERWDVCNQNDAWLKSQNMDWHTDYNLMNFDPQMALDYVNQDPIRHFKQGRKSLQFMNNPNNIPWLIKDPRMAITISVWLNYMEELDSHHHDLIDDKSEENLFVKNPPAILFTFRHPMEVALSLNKREHDFPIEKGLRLWIIYNQKAIQSTQQSCRVYTYNGDIIHNSLQEIRRITTELTDRCGVPPAPHVIQQKEVDLFFDGRLQHNAKAREVEDCMKEYEEAGDIEKQRKYYREVMQIYCDLKSGKAYEDGYLWPSL